MEAIHSIIERQDRKTLAISISRNGEVIVKAPFSMPLSEIKNFVNEKYNWIVSKLLSIKNNLSHNADIINYENFLFLGIKHKPYWAKVKYPVFDSENRFLIPQTLSDSDTLHSISKFYRKEAKRILSQRVKSISNVMNVRFKNFKISNAKSRWGSCSANGTVSFNWRLIMLQTKLIDYVIVHELAHLVYLDHSSSFWNYISSYIHNYDILRKDLKSFSFVLDLFR